MAQRKLKNQGVIDNKFKFDWEDDVPVQKN